MLQQAQAGKPGLAKNLQDSGDGAAQRYAEHAQWLARGGR